VQLLDQPHLCLLLASAACACCVQLAAMTCDAGSLASRVAEVGAAVREAIKVRRGFLVTTGEAGGKACCR
jgi:hypothetical protein